ncbi:MAG: hypothetical protein K0Q95_3097 [Bacteroidota bacterium]|jgi:hypothetical protein|nr:hypothetical protein [Bacteroidota bacterium]
MRILLKVFLLLITSTSLLIADNDTSKVSSFTRSATKYYSLNQLNSDSSSVIDNSLYEFHKYIPKNTLGNNGLAFNDLNYRIFQSEVGFHFFKNNYLPYFFTPQKLRFYNTRTPYTDLFYIIGSKKEQFFKMTFSYNVKKNWNLTVDFLRIRSEGIYLRQNTNDNSLALSTNYKSDENRYSIAAGIIYNSYKNAENGGIANDSIFQNGQSVDKRLLEINLSSAKKHISDATVFTKQIFNFGRRLSDSLTRNQIISGNQLILSSSVNAFSHKYDDSNLSDGYYSSVFYDSTLTSDSTFTYKVENELAWRKVDNKQHRGLIDMIGYGLSVKHEFIGFKQKETDSTFNNIIAGAELYNTYSNNLFYWILTGKSVISGFNNGDYEVTAKIRKESRDSLLSIIISGTERVSKPDFIYHYYKSNHFSWNNDFEKTGKRGIDLTFAIKKAGLFVGSSVYRYSNVTYFDNYAMARQFPGNLNVFSASVKKDFTFFNWHLNNMITYQKTADSSVIRIPEFMLDHSLYYENDLFKKAMLLQIGASVFYTSSYYSNAYMPATSQFYLQNDYKYGSYPFIDFFINAQVKSVRVFIKVDHLNSGWTGNKYIMTPGYPYPGRTFKFGVSWKFYD